MIEVREAPVPISYSYDYDRSGMYVDGYTYAGDPLTPDRVSSWFDGLDETPYRGFVRINLSNGQTVIVRAKK